MAPLAVPRRLGFVELHITFSVTYDSTRVFGQSLGPKRMFDGEILRLRFEAEKRVSRSVYANDGRRCHELL